MNLGEYITLGNTELKISPIGLGTMRWKDKPEIRLTDNSVNSSPFRIYNTSIQLGINFFDTAEIYGFGRSEIYLGQCYKQLPDHAVLASKFFPFPWRLSKGELRKSLVNSLQRLGINRIDLYQIHWPFPPVPITTWMHAMADMVNDGLVRAVGVSNYSKAQTEKAFEYLSRFKIPLASNQIKYSLLERMPERNGLLKRCDELGVRIIAYSPLESGILSGKYTQNNAPPDFRSWRYNKAYLKRIEPLITELRSIGKRYDGRTPAQVSLNWLVSKGVIPIPGAKDVDQAIEIAGALGWSLTQEDIDRLDFVSNRV